MHVNLPLKIIGLGRYLPSRVVSSAELEKMCNVPAGWVEHRNGVRERRWVTDETSSFMAAQAAREALDEAGPGRVGAVGDPAAPVEGVRRGQAPAARGYLPRRGLPGLDHPPARKGQSYVSHLERRLAEE